MINSHFVTNFIKHYWSATRIDVLHSPFVFDLYNVCIKQQEQPNTDINQIENLRSELLKDKRMISQQDLGAGGNTNDVKQHSIGFFAHKHAKQARLAGIIYRLVNHYRCKHIIELGTSLGISSSYIASAVKKNYTVEEADFTTIEGAPEIAAIASGNFKKMNLENYIQQVTGNFDNALQEVVKNYKDIDLAFIDGNHRYEPTINYFKQILPLMHNDGIIIFDDIYWSEGMTKAWNEIKQHPDVTVTVDLFFIGIVFFRKQQAKEHFRLRVL